MSHCIILLGVPPTSGNDRTDGQAEYPFAWLFSGLAWAALDIRPYACHRCNVFATALIGAGRYISVHPIFEESIQTCYAIDGGISTS